MRRTEAERLEDRLEDLTNELIGVIWVALDEGIAKSDIRDCVNNTLDAWKPKEKTK